MGVEQRFVFDGVADLYDRARPGYPKGLVQHVLREAGLASPGRLLEIGCGSGQATRPFAAHGHAIVALEPGKRLAALARGHLDAEARVEIRETTFEDWRLEPDAFDLVYSAQAIHWVPPDVRFPKTAAALRPGGWLAVFGNLPLPGDSQVRRAIDAAYAEHVPGFAGGLPATGSSSKAPPIPEQLDAAPEYGPAHVRDFPWRESYDASRYLELLQTQSDHRLLPSGRRDALLSGVAAAIEAHGGSVEVGYVARLAMARRAEGA